MARLLITSALAAMLAAGCGDSPPSSPAPPAGGGETISGRERFGWMQPAGSATELALYRYAVYVDGIRRVVEGATCAARGSAGGFDCSAPLPPLTPGRHTLELAAFITADGGAVIEGARSEPLHVTVVAATASAPNVQAGTFTSPDGLSLHAAILADDLLDPIDFAVAGDGRVFVAERAGRIRVIGDPGDEGPAENALDLFRRADDEAELLSIALSPDFQRTALLHVAVGATEHGERVLHLARLRAGRGFIAEAAILSSHQVSLGTTVLIRFGPDRHLYAGVGAGIDPDAAQQLSAAAGKILRLREDGGTPEDNPWSSPVWSTGHRDPRGLAWYGDHTLWEVEGDEHGDEVNAIRPGGNYGWPIVRGAQAHPQVTRPAVILPAGTEASGIATVPLPSSPLYGSLIVSARAGQDLLRIRLDGHRRQQRTSPLLQGRFGQIGQVASGLDGALYVITANAHGWGEGRDMLIRLMPAAPATRPQAR